MLFRKNQFFIFFRNNILLLLFILLICFIHNNLRKNTIIIKKYEPKFGLYYKSFVQKGVGTKYKTIHIWSYPQKLAIS